MKPDLVPIWVTSNMNEVTNRTSGRSNPITNTLQFFPGAIEKRSLLSLADGSQISNCSLPCTTHQIYAWHTHQSKSRAPTFASSKSARMEKEESLTDGDIKMDGLEERMKDRKRGQKQEIILIFSQQVIC